jgi:hypothetical protein
MWSKIDEVAQTLKRPATEKTSPLKGAGKVLVSSTVSFVDMVVYIEFNVKNSALRACFR